MKFNLKSVDKTTWLGLGVAVVSVLASIGKSELEKQTAAKKEAELTAKITNNVMKELSAKQD